ncbi:hypothetical protein [Treponema pedis]|uniref:hypothetical protein n=1 Tax=Treponema pedis TaxID=409322 RepID=UPI003D25DC72
MKQRKVVSVIGALVLIISAVVFITGCSQPNSNKENTGNNGGTLEVQPTGKADPALKGTRWESTADVSIEFTENGNIANISGDQALYTVEGEKINFDLSSQISNFKNMTEAKFIQENKSLVKNHIAELEKEIKEAEKNGDEQKKKEKEKDLEKAKGWLNALEHPDEDLQEAIKEEVKKIHAYASKMDPYAKFEGIFNSEKKKLTIEKFPHYDWRTKEVAVKTIVFEKNT